MLTLSARAVHHTLVLFAQLLFIDKHFVALAGRPRMVNEIQLEIEDKCPCIFVKGVVRNSNKFEILIRSSSLIRISNHIFYINY